MVQKTTHPAGRAFTYVLALTFRHWRAKPVSIAGIAALALATALGYVLTQLFGGRLGDALTHVVAADAMADALSRAMR
ncbi:ABC transporter ATP-binding protein, partial [Burkholderia pseudomallei]